MRLTLYRGKAAEGATPIIFDPKIQYTRHTQIPLSLLLQDPADTIANITSVGRLHTVYSARYDIILLPLLPLYYTGEHDNIPTQDGHDDHEFATRISADCCTDHNNIISARMTTIRVETEGNNNYYDIIPI